MKVGIELVLGTKYTTKNLPVCGYGLYLPDEGSKTHEAELGGVKFTLVSWDSIKVPNLVMYIDLTQFKHNIITLAFLDKLKNLLAV